MTLQLRRILGQSLLVAGSAVGAGLLALPAVTYRAGIIPSCAALLLVWMYMFASSLLLIETASRVDSARPSHLLSMASGTLGQLGKRICFALYVVVYSATMCAYCAEGGKQAVELLYSFAEYANAESGINASTSSGSVSGHNVALGQILFAGTFGFVIYRGSGDVEMFNSSFMVGTIVSFGALVRAAMTETTSGGDISVVVSSDEPLSDNNATIFPCRRGLPSIGTRALHSDWSELPRAFPILIVAFSYHNMVSSVLSNVEKNTKECAISILIGSAISCIMYIVWLAVILGASDTNEEYLTAQSQVVVAPLTEEDIFEKLHQSSGFSLPLFSFFALVTSVLGVGLGCVDFMEEVCSSDGSYTSTSPIHVMEEEGRILLSTSPLTKVQKRRLRATFLTFCPSLLVAVAFPKAFLPLLEFSGIFRLALFGAMPVAMAWKSRKIKRCGKSVEMAKLYSGNDEEISFPDFQGGHMLPGGNVGLCCFLAMTSAIASLQLRQILEKVLS